MKLALISLGCSKNLVDSEHFLGILSKKGLEITPNIDESDIVLVNTCGFIGDAKIESIDTILEVGELKKAGKIKHIIVAGCLSQKYSQELMKELPEIDGIIGTGDVDKIGELVDEMMANKKPIKTQNLTFLANAKTERIRTTSSHSAYLKISEGCNRKCTYCVIPQMRGRLRSRTIEDIVLEAKQMISEGVREIILLAQETTEYGIDLYGKAMLAPLMEELCKIEGLMWLRAYYMHPEYLTDELIDTIKKEDKICKYFDVPIQHVTTHILRNMARAKSGEQVKNVLSRIRNKIPNATIRTTLIVGFPGETEKDFNELMEFVEEFKFDYAGVFKYSQEEDTRAFSLPNQVPEDIKEKRYATLTNLQSEIAQEKNRKLLGQTVEVMIDGISSESKYMLEGRMRSQALEIDGKVLTTSGTAKAGEIVKVELTQNFDYDFTSEIVENEKK